MLWPRRSTRCTRPSSSATKDPGRTSTPPVLATAEWVHWYGHHPATLRHRDANPRRARSRLGTRHPPPRTITTGNHQHQINQPPQNPGLDKGVAARGVPQRLRGRQRHRSGPQPKRVYRTPGGARALPGGSSPSPPSPTTPPPRARTSVSARPCSATWTSSPWPPPSPSFRSRSTVSTSSTTPSAPTRAYPDASPRSRPGTPPRWPRHPDRTATPPPSPQEARPLSQTPPHGAGCVGTSPSVPPDSAS